MVVGDDGLEGGRGEVVEEVKEEGVRWEPTAVFLKADGRTLVWLLLKGVFAICVSSDCYICVLILQCMCPHTSTCVLMHY